MTKSRVPPEFAPIKISIDNWLDVDRFRWSLAEMKEGRLQGDAQRMLARMLDRCTMRRGRPRNLLRVGHEQLVLTVDWMVDHYSGLGSTDPEGEAIAEALKLEKQEGRNVDLETMRRYLRAGAKGLAEGEMRIANRVDQLREELEKEGSNDPENHAFQLVAREIGATVLIAKRRYDRGKSAMRRKGRSASVPD